MNPTHHPVIRALPLAGVLLLPNLCGASAPGSIHPADVASNSTPAPINAPGLAAGIPAERLPPQRIMSDRLAAILSASLPKFIPKPASNGKEATDQRGGAGPDDSILHLPKYVVHGPRIPAFSERDIHTQRGLAEIAQRRYITQLDRALNRYRIPFFGISTESRALAMYAEDERLQNMADLDRMARNAALVDRAGAAHLKHLADATYQRTD